MDELGLWKLFLATGDPRVWLILRGLRREREKQELAVPAFRDIVPEPI